MVGGFQHPRALLPRIGVSQSGTSQSIVYSQRQIFVPPLLATLVLWLTTTNNIPPEQLILTVALFFIPSWCFATWRSRERDQLPLIGLVSGSYCVYFVLSIYWTDVRSVSLFDFGKPISTDTIGEVLRMVTLGMFAMLWGARVSSLMLHFPRPTAVLVKGRFGQPYLYGVLALGAVGPTMVGDSGDSGRQIFMILFTLVPLVAFLILLEEWLEGQRDAVKTLFLGAYLAFRTFTGLSAGVLGSVAGILLVVAITYLRVKRKIPLGWTALIVACVLFLQPGKSDFRKKYWDIGVKASRIDRMAVWVSFAGNQWADVLAHPNLDRFHELCNASLSRLSLLNQAAIVIEKTPGVVPYQNGAMYSYFAVTLIPRFLWPEKPSFNEANRFYQVAYGLSRQRDLEGVSIAVGALPEAYISFGWIGVAGVMFGLGVIYDLFQRLLFRNGGSSFWSAIGVAMIPSLLAIESQLVQYLAGIVQMIGLTYVVFIPIMAHPRTRMQADRLPGSSQSAPALRSGAARRWAGHAR